MRPLSQGMNDYQRRLVDNWHSRGYDVAWMSREIECEPWVITEYLDRMAAKDRQQSMAEAAEADDVPAQGYYLRQIESGPEGVPPDARLQQDDLGPMPGSVEWQNLNPKVRGGLTRKRNARAKKARLEAEHGDHDTV